MTLFSNVPRELTELRAWVLWNASKMPLQPNGQPAKANDPETWNTFADCQQAAERKGQGIGFELHPPLVGIDLDKCIDSDGTINAEASEIIGRFAGCYVEISPSGRGLHIIAKGSKPAGCKSRVELPDGSRIEFYGGGRYLTITGDQRPEWEPCDDGVPEVQDAIDWLVGKYLVPEQPASITTSATAGLPTFDDHRKQKLASQYLATMEPSVSGSSGHNALYRAAIKTLEGFDLGNEATYQLLAAEFNPRCVPLWNESDLRRKVSEARKVAGQQNAIGYLLEPLPERESLIDKVDMTGLLSSWRESVGGGPDDEDTEALPDDDGDEVVKPLPDWAVIPSGTLGDIVRYQLGTAMSPQPILSLAGAIAMLSAVYGRLVEDERRTRTNLYVVALAPTCGGKSHPRKCAHQILSESGWGKLYGPDDLSSGPGIFADLKDAPNHKRLYPVDEFDKSLAAMTDPKNRSGPEVSAKRALLQLWEMSNSYFGGAARVSGDNCAMHSPHAVVFGTCPVTGFENALTPESVTDGFLNRMLLFHNGDHWPDEPDELQPFDVPQTILDDLGWWSRFHPSGGNMTTESGAAERLATTTEAAAMLKDHRQAIRRRFPNESEAKRAIWGRTAEKAAKLAMIHACSRQRQGLPEITVDDVRWGRVIANHCTRQMAAMVGRFAVGSEYESDQVTILQYVKQSEKGYRTLTDLSRAKGTRKFRSKYRGELLAALVEAKQIAVEKRQTAGRPTMRIWRADRAPEGTLFASPADVRRE